MLAKPFTAPKRSAGLRLRCLRYQCKHGRVDCAQVLALFPVGKIVRFASREEPNIFREGHKIVSKAVNLAGPGIAGAAPGSAEADRQTENPIRRR